MGEPGGPHSGSNLRDFISEAPGDGTPSEETSSSTSFEQAESWGGKHQQARASKLRRVRRPWTPRTTPTFQQLEVSGLAAARLHLQSWPPVTAPTRPAPRQDLHHILAQGRMATPRPPSLNVSRRFRTYVGSLIQPTHDTRDAPSLSASLASTDESSTYLPTPLICAPIASRSAAAWTRHAGLRH